MADHIMWTWQYTTSSHGRADKWPRYVGYHVTTKYMLNNSNGNAFRNGYKGNMKMDGAPEARWEFN